jgi:hypothetical protein
MWRIAGFRSVKENIFKRSTIIGTMCLAACATLVSFPALAEDVPVEIPARHDGVEGPGPLKGIPATGTWLDRITLSGVIEVEAAYEKRDFADESLEDEDASDLSLATMELCIDAAVTEYVSGHILFHYEDDEDVSVDEAFVTLGGSDKFPLYLKAGKRDVPFGNFSSNMISDPLTLEVGETRETAVEIGIRQHGFYGALYAFNGDNDLEGKENHIDSFGAAAGYVYEKDSFSLDVGVGYINNIYDSDVLTDMTIARREEAEALGYSVSLKDQVPGMTAYAVMNAGPFRLIGEYVAMLEDPKFELSDVVPGTLASLGLGNTAKADGFKAWNVEIGYTFSLAGKETTAGMAYQGVTDGEEAFPERRIMGVVSMGILEHTTFSLEYLHDRFENDDKRNQVTAQLALEF